MAKTLIGNIKGPQGEIGPQGEQGIQGLKGDRGDRGSRWLTGTAITGIDTIGTVFSNSGISDALLEDYYLNTDSGNLYRCIEAGDADTAKWVYVGNLTLMNEAVQISVVENTENITELSNLMNVKNTSGSWTLGSNLGGAMLYSITYGKGTFVAVNGNGMVYYSKGSDSWSSTNIVEGMMMRVFDVFYAEDKFIAGGSGGIYYSYDDGISWTAVQGTGMAAQGLGYGNGKFVAVNSNYHYYSEDGISWSVGGMSAEGYYMHKVAYGNGLFMAVGDNGTTGKYSYSNDGITWTDGSWDFATGLADVVFGNDVFVAVAQSGGIYYSSSANIGWTAANSPTTNNLNRVIYDGGKFIAVGAAGTVCYSYNGINWTLEENTVTTNELSGLVYADNKYIAVGAAGTVCYGGIIKKSALSINRVTLTAGSTEITIEDERITEDSFLSFYTSIYGVNPTAVTVGNRSVTLTFDAQEADMEVGVRVDG